MVNKGNEEVGLKRVYISEVGQFLRESIRDSKVLSVAKQDEIEKHKRISQLRDNAVQVRES